MERNSSLEGIKTLRKNHVVIFNSIGGHLPKNLGFTEYLNLDINQSRKSGYLHPIPVKVTNEFIPYLNERDGLNQLLTSPHRDHLPKEPSNPSLYYKGERFKRQRLIQMQAERNQNSLTNLLVGLRKKKAELKPLEKGETHRRDESQRKRVTNRSNQRSFFFNLDSHLNLPESHSNLSPELQESRQGNTISSPHLQSIIETPNMTPCLIKYKERDDVKRRKKHVSVSVDTSMEETNITLKKKPMKSTERKKQSINPSDSFENFYKKLENERQSPQMKFKNITQKNLKALDEVLRKFEEGPIVRIPRSQSPVVKRESVQLQQQQYLRARLRRGSPRRAENSSILVKNYANSSHHQSSPQLIFPKSTMASQRNEWLHETFRVVK